MTEQFWEECYEKFDNYDWIGCVRGGAVSSVAVSLSLLETEFFNSNPNPNWEFCGGRPGGYWAGSPYHP